MAALLAVPAFGQHALSVRTFEPSLPAVAPTPVPPVAEWWRLGGPRIRSTDSRIAAALRNGLERSHVLRRLVDTIESNDVVVYTAVDQRMADGLSGRLTFMGVGGGYRYVRVAVHPELKPSLVIAALAHELQHVVEVVEHPEVTSEAALTALYKRIGYSNMASGRVGWETDAAHEIGLVVLREMLAGSAAIVASGEAPQPAPRR
jgi:hypothetical protein